jgi:hypothetical protein
MAFTHTKKVNTESFIKARIRIRSQTSGSGFDKKGPDPTGSGSATLLESTLVLHLVNLKATLQIRSILVRLRRRFLNITVLASALSLHPARFTMFIYFRRILHLLYACPETGSLWPGKFLTGIVIS